MVVDVLTAQDRDAGGTAERSRGESLFETYALIDEFALQGGHEGGEPLRLVVGQDQDDVGGGVDGNRAAT